MLFGLNISAQRVFTNEEQDCIAHDLTQLKALRVDSALQAQNYQDCDSAKKVIQDKFDIMKSKFDKCTLAGDSCQTSYNALLIKHNKLANKFKPIKNTLLVTIPITILEGVAIYFQWRRKN